MSAGPPVQRLALGDALYVAVPATRARAAAYVLALGARVLRERDGVAGLDWLDELLEQLRVVDAELRSEPPARSAGSGCRTVEASIEVEPALWAHDTVTIAEAVPLTGLSPGYLARLGRDGLGHKRGGAWHLDRDRLLARLPADRG